MTARDNGFRTRRLQVRHWQALLSDTLRRQKLAVELEAVLRPNVLRHLPETLQIAGGPKAVDNWISARAAESDVMLARDAVNGELLGLLILAEFPQPNSRLTVHLGYLLAEGAWGKGYASELLSGLLDWYRGRGQSVQLLGGVEKDNVASARVLQKNGFERDDDLSSGSTVMFSRVI